MKIHRYTDLGYTTFFNPRTGFFARVEDKDNKEPFWSPHGPELLDIAITNWCDKGCTFCYRSSSKTGAHMLIEDYKKVIDAAFEMGVYQVALGGGNPNQHPQFVDMLEYPYMKGIVPNYTTNGRGLSDEVIESSRKVCGAVAVSAYPPYDEAVLAIEKLVESEVKVNIHFILDSDSISTAINWLESPPEILIGINALVFLNYKPSGQKIFEDNLLRHSDRVQEFFDIATSKKHKFKIGFDSCCVSGLFARTNSKVETIDACDAGRFSMFISEDMKAYPCSFQKALHSGDNVTSKEDIHRVWMESPNFKSFRDYFSSDRCSGCPSQSQCKNGCPLFEDIVVCGHR